MPPVRSSSRIANLKPRLPTKRPGPRKTACGKSDRTVNSESESLETSDSSDDEDGPLRLLEEINDLDEGEGEACEIHMYQVRYDSRGERVCLQTGSRSELEWEREPSHEAALVITRFYSPLKELQSTRLAIQSPHIKKALRDVVGSYPGIDINSKGPIYLFDEPRCLFHYYDALETYAAAKDKTIQRHVKLCLQYVAKHLREEIAAYNIMMKNEAVAPGLEYKNLWMAFKPGALIYGITNVGGKKIIARLRDIQQHKRKDLPDVWAIETEYIECNGDYFGFVSTHHTIPRYDGYRPLTELVTYPLSYCADQEIIKDNLIARGRLFVSLCGGIHHKLYDGPMDCIVEYLPSTGHPQGPTAPPPLPNDEMRGPCSMMKVDRRVILDCKEFNSSIKKMVFLPGAKNIQIQTNDHLNLSEEELLMCSFVVPGFFLATKRWYLLDVSGIKDIAFNTTAFEKLVIPQDKKDLISSLITIPQKETSTFDDLIEGKGKGLIFLLHGPPGVGKTFTAESISEYTKRPLYNIGCANLGSSVFAVERTLDTALYLATRWNAIVLLDEADVFMEVRSSNDLKRNALVSVLLRTLEYFQGIMFLTTNRVWSLDPAFKSRIHLSITYPSFSMESRIELWKTFILNGSSSQYRWLNEKFLKRIGKEEINGRQIKNIVRMAYSRANNGERAMVANDILVGLNALKTFEVDFSHSHCRKEREGSLSK